MGTVAKIKKKNKTFELSLMIILSMFLFYPPFFRGLFISFTKEVLMTHILSFCLFMTYLIYKQISKEKIIFDSIVNYIAFFLIVAYTLPVVFAQWANLREAVGEIIRYANVFMLYLIVKDLIVNEKYKNIVLITLVVGGVFVALTGLFSAMGFGELTDAVLDGNRISSTFQYPNTLAAYVGTLVFINFELLNKSKEKWKKACYATAGFILFFTFVFTYSRAAWLLMPLFALALIVLLKGKSRINAIAYLVTVTIPALVVMQPFTKLMGGEAKTKGTLVFLGSLALFALLYLLMDYLKDKIHAIRPKAVYAFLVVVILLGAGAGYVAINTTQPLVLDNLNVSENRNNTVSRNVSSINGNDSYILHIELEAEATEDENNWPWRVQIYGLNKENESTLLHQEIGVATEIIQLEIPFNTFEDTDGLSFYFTNQYAKTKVIFNSAELYNQQGELIHQFKLSYKYIPEALVSRINAINLSDRSSTARLIFYQDALRIFKDYPIVGAGGGAWANLYEQYQSEPYNSTTTHSYFLSTLVDVGLIGTGLLLTLIIVLILQLIKSVKEKNELSIVLLIAIFFLLAHSALDFNFSFFSIMILFWVLIACLDIKMLPQRLKFKMHNSVGYVLVLPFLIVSISLYSGHSSALKAVQAVQANDGQQAYEAFEKAVKRDPFTYNYRLDLAQLLQLIGTQQGDQELADLSEKHQLKALKYAPNNIEVYQKIIVSYIEQGEFDKAIELANKVPALAPYRTRGYELKFNSLVAKGTHFLQQGNVEQALELYQQSESIVDDLMFFNQKTDKPIIFSDEMLLAINRVKYIARNINNVSKVNQVNNLAYISYFDMDADQNNIPDGWRLFLPEESKIKSDIIPEGGVSIFNEPEGNGLFHTNNFSLRPNTTYKIKMLFKDGSAIENARLAIYSREGTTVQLAPTATNQNEIEIEFTTTDDIIEGYQYIRIEHMAKSSESFAIKSIAIFEID